MAETLDEKDLPPNKRHDDFGSHDFNLSDRATSHVPEKPGVGSLK
jgi:hypothetical protein